MRKLNPTSRYDINVVAKAIDRIVSEGVYINDAIAVEDMLKLEDKIESSMAMADDILATQFNWESINPKSPKQISEFYTYHGFEKYGNPGKSGINFPTESLIKIVELNNEFEEITKLFITIMADRYSLSAMESVRRFGQPTEYEGINIVYPDYNQADSGRIQWVKPNLSNLGERKRMVTGGPGYKLISLDYKNQEPWIIANFLKIKSIMDRMARGEDYYKGLVSEYAGIDISDEERSIFKTAIIAMGYLCTLPTALMDIPKHLKGTMKEIYTNFTNLPEINEFRNKIKESFNSDRMMRTYFDTPWEVKWYKGMRYDAWERSAFNRPFQATGVDLLFFALEGLEKLYEEIGGDIRTYLTLHDEIVIRVKEELVTDELIERLKDTVLFDVEGWTPLRVDIKILDNWLDD